MKKEIKVLGGIGLLAGVGLFIYSKLNAPIVVSTNNTDLGEFPIYDTCINTETECVFDLRVQNVQVFLNTQGGFGIAEDGLFGVETLETLEEYLLDYISNEEYIDLGYDLVQIPNYITLAFYESIP